MTGSQNYRITTNGLVWRVERLEKWRFLFWLFEEWCLCYTKEDAPAEYTSYDAAKAAMLKSVERDAARHDWVVVEHSANKEVDRDE